MKILFRTFFIFLLISIISCGSYRETKHGYKIKGKSEILFDGIDTRLDGNARLSGFVYSRDKKEFPSYARIQVGDTELTTDNNGFFEISIRPGVYTVVAKCLGDNDEVIEYIKLTENSSVIVLFELGTVALY